MSGRSWRPAAHFAAMTVALGLIAAVAPPPWYLTDRDTYERVGRQILVPDCSDLHCFRMLVPIVVEQLPGPSWVKWKAYAVAANAAAAFLAGRVALAFGASARAAMVATWISALGFGSLFTLFDPHTADPLMFALGPALALLLLAGRVGRASGLSAVGVFAKEFAAAPLWIAAGAAALAGHRRAMIRLVVGAAAVTTLWVLFQLTMLTVFDYSYANSHSVRLSEGAYFMYWIREVGARTAVSSLLTEFGALYLLIPAGLFVAPLELRRWAIASIPAALIFGYVQQPDRALWNFHFIATPLAALAVSRLPRSAAWIFVGAYGLANLRIGAQLQFLPPARYGLLASGVIAVWAVVRLWRHRREVPSVIPSTAVVTNRMFSRRERRALGWLVTVTAVALLAASAVMLDAALHRRSERMSGLNKWGYRGPVMKHKAPGEIRVAVVGGSFAFGYGVEWDHSFAAALERYARQGWRPLHVRVPFTVVNLATPADSPASFTATLQDYDYLRPDIVVVVAEPGAHSTDARGWRQQSAVFRATGYLPALPALWGAHDAVPARAEALANGDNEQILALVHQTVAAGRRAIVVSPPPRSARDRDGAQALADAIRSRFTDDSRVRYLNLERVVDVRDPAMSPGGIHLTPLGHEQVTDALTNVLLEMLQR